MTGTPALLVYATYRLSPDGDVEAFRSLALRMMALGKARDGCVFFDVAQDVGNPATFRLVEGWRDQPAQDAYGASGEFQDLLKEAAAFQAGNRTIDVYSVADKKTIDLPL